ncbi:MAG: hypothetical protein OEW35_11055 [Gammaproteobacteria bacterium]|nr:hypothetical protein [Gammaproteobacteria bacterium]MDH4253900.1 hypothetical protein [Gammaproteobacteria bacterium]MDH5309787.1 hypothetical protein [Gammaproteobacteria bacterium]
MSEKNPIRVYVSHLFRADSSYLRVFEFLESVERFFYINTSRPENMPQSGGLAAIKDEYIAQIKQAEVAVILASQFDENADLLRYQMDVAEANDKPVIVIRPFGGVRDTAPELAKRARKHLEWNEREIVDAVRQLARHEDTARWDVIDFP